MKRFIPTSVALILLSVSLSACSPGETSKSLDQYLSQEVSWAECSEDLFVEVDQQSSLFKSLTPDCSTVLVPANYETSSAENKEFGIALMRISKATESDFKGTLFINPGGPGGSGIEQLQWSNFPDGLVKHFDIVGFDPRGVGASQFTDGTEIKCSDELDYRTYFEGEASPSNFEEYQASIPLSDEYYNDCVDRNPLWWTLSTSNVVDDLDVMKQVITGDEPLNFIGTSYGTTIAGLYVSKYPENVGKIVLDSPTTVDEDPIKSAVENYKAMETKLNSYLDYYAEQEGKTSAEAWQDLLYVKQMADDDELIGYAGLVRSDTEPSLMVSSESLLTRGILALNYFPEQDAKEEFAKAIKEAIDYQSNWAFEFYALRMDGYDPESLKGSSLSAKKLKRSNSFEIMTIVNSMDYSPEELSAQDQKKMAKQMKAAAPKLYALNLDFSGYQYYGESLGVDWVSIANEDDSIPDPPTTPLIRENKSGKKLLIVGSIYEAVTPYQFSKDTAKLLKSPLISVESSTHGPAAGYDIPCLNDVLIDFFVNDIVPADMTCKA
jgi:pimeloyl-ACP methyl ester carboxylesterase